MLLPGACEIPLNQEQVSQPAQRVRNRAGIAYITECGHRFVVKGGGTREIALFGKQIREVTKNGSRGVPVADLSEDRQCLLVRLLSSR